MPRTEDAIYAFAYWNVKREPRDGSLAEAIKVHAQACGLVAFVLDLHPDTVARAVADRQKSEEPPE